MRPWPSGGLLRQIKNITREKKYIYTSRQYQHLMYSAAILEAMHLICARNESGGQEHELRRILKTAFRRIVHSTVQSRF
jgi:hypothetical protein